MVTMEIAYTKVENACLDGVAIIGMIVDSLCCHSSLKVFINLVHGEKGAGMEF